MNVGSAGVSWNLGPRGASVSIGQRGIYLNSSLPGVGLSARTRLGGSAASTPRTRVTPSRAHPTQQMSLAVEVTDDGEVRLTDSSGTPVSSELVKRPWRRKAITFAA